MAHTITLIPGDGIGPEVTQAAVEILEATGVQFNWEIQNAGAGVVAEFGEPMPQHVLDSILTNKVALKGPLGTPIGKGFKSANVALRKALKLYANLRPAKTIPGVRSRYDKIDLVIVRENTEDLYAGIEHMVNDDIAVSQKIITREASTRIARFAFEHARHNGRKEVAAIHKANIMKLADGLFLDAVRNVAVDYPEIKYREVIVDNLCMQLVINPHQFDVLVLENLYGDIVSDLCAGLVGGLGVVPGANIGEKAAVFEAVHGSAPDIAGQGIANPLAVLMSGIMMLNHLGEHAAADRLTNSVYRVIGEGKVLTHDLGGTASTAEFTAELIRRLH